MPREKDFYRGYNKTALLAKLKQIINEQPMFTEWQSEFVSDVFTDLHYKLKGQRPVRFRKDKPLPGFSGYTFLAYYPHYGWDSVSVSKCVNHPDVDTKLTAYLRNAVIEQTFGHRHKHPICQLCGKYAATEVDHIYPEFAVIADVARTLVSKSERKQLDDRLFSPEHWEFELPSSHLAIEFIQWVHLHLAVMQAVCTGCHRSDAEQRKFERSFVGSVKVTEAYHLAILKQYKFLIMVKRFISLRKHQ